ncbi:MAG: hypothetical protein IIT65_14905, partial [Lachnospiraceae bacterium]|nr:hypothetical protein [Lachnospiraceae bacterium]
RCARGTSAYSTAQIMQAAAFLYPVYKDNIEVIPDFDMDKYISQYVHSQDKSDTYLGRFFNGALSQKKMVAEKIKESGNKLAGM